MPCFNEADRLDPAAWRAFDAAGQRTEFLFVNDGSTDGTLDLLRRMAAESAGTMRVLDVQPNQGKAEAVRRGMLATLERRPDLVGFWDADLSTPLDAVGGFLDVFERQPAIQMVFGARVALLGRAIRRRPWRHYLGRVFATIVSVLIGLPIYDTQCGAKIFRVRPELAQVLARPFVSPWLFDVELLIRFLGLEAGGRAALAGAVYELPLMAWQDVRGSKLGGTAYVRAATTLGRVMVTYRDILRRGRW